MAPQFTKKIMGAFIEKMNSDPKTKLSLTEVELLKDFVAYANEKSREGCVHIHGRMPRIRGRYVAAGRAVPKRSAQV